MMQPIDVNHPQSLPFHCVWALATYDFPLSFHNGFNFPTVGIDNQTGSLILFALMVLFVFHSPFSDLQHVFFPYSLKTWKKDNSCKV